MSYLNPTQEKIAKELRDLSIPVTEDKIIAYAEGKFAGAKEIGAVFGKRKEEMEAEAKEA